MYRPSSIDPRRAGVRALTCAAFGLVLLFSLTACDDDDPTAPGGSGGDPVAPEGLVEFFLEARALDGQPLPGNSAGEVEVTVGETFLLEVSYADLRDGGEDTGLFALAVDLLTDQADKLEPVLSETQNLIFGAELGPAIQADPTGTIMFGIEGSGATYSSPGADFASDPMGEIEMAMQTFGFTRGTDYELLRTSPSNGDTGFRIRWSIDGYANVDAPDLLAQPRFDDPVNSQLQEFAPFGPDGVTINEAGLYFNVFTSSRDFNDGEEFYTAQPGLGFDAVDGFLGLSAVGPIVAGGIPDAADDGLFAEPFHALGVPVRLKEAVDRLEIRVMPANQVDGILMYGRDDAVGLEDVWVDGDAVVLVSGV